ncbi:MAG: SDR family NAD(P)-dependent oxidoreductase [Janthinobacterium lividum]
MTGKQKTIIITGSSSGIGFALAARYAAPNVKLHLFGRSQVRLNLISNICLEKGAKVQIFTGNICDKYWLKEQIQNICNENKVDLLVAAAGVSAGTIGGIETEHQVDEIFSTNLEGALNTLMPALPFMIENMSGHIVLFSSMAGLIPLSSAPSYSASKAAIKFFGDSLRVYLKPFKVRVSVIIPGYIDTPMTRVNNFPMPFIIPVDKATNIIIKGLEKNKGVIAFPISTYILLKFINLLPYKLIDYINSKLPGSPAFGSKNEKE